MPALGITTSLSTLSGCEGLRLPADLVDCVVGQRHDIEIAVWALLDAGRRAEARADLQRFALGAVEFLRAEKVVGYAVGQARIGADVDVLAVCRERKAIEAAPIGAHLLVGAGRPHPPRAVVFRSQRSSFHECRPGRADLLPPAATRIP